MSGEFLGFLMERLMQQKALDVWYTPIYMKKNRPGVKVSVLCHPEDQEKLENILLQETTTLGVRSYSAFRKTLQRQWVKVNTEYGDIRIKVAHQEQIHKASPEYEDCRQAAQGHGVSLREVYEAAMQAYFKSKKHIIRHINSNV
jgi:hypothetical protein